MKYVKALLANKYVFTFAIFMIWLTFFDKNSLLALSALQRSIDVLEEEKDYFKTELDKMDDKINFMTVDRERYAREHFYLHRENEIVYVIKE